MTTSTTERAEQARHDRDQARQHLADVVAGLALAQQRQADYHLRYSTGLATSPATMRERADQVEHARLLVAPAEQAAAEAETAYALVVADDVTEAVLTDARINGDDQATVRDQISAMLDDAVQLAMDYYVRQGQALAEINALATDADMPTARTERGKHPWQINVRDVSDPLAAVYTVPSTGGLVVETDDGNLVIVEPPNDQQVAARDLVRQILTGVAA